MRPRKEAASFLFCSPAGGRAGGRFAQWICQGCGRRFFTKTRLSASRPDVGDSAGLPINAQRACAPTPGTPRLLTLPEHQCKPQPSIYGFRAWGISVSQRDRRGDAGHSAPCPRTSMAGAAPHDLDGRPSASAGYAPHTWQGLLDGPLGRATRGRHDHCT